MSGNIPSTMILLGDSQKIIQKNLIPYGSQKNPRSAAVIVALCCSLAKVLIFPN
jgi:hypothetical protein